MVATVVGRPSSACGYIGHGPEQGTFDTLSVSASIESTLKPTHVVRRDIDQRASAKSVEVRIEPGDCLLDTANVRHTETPVLRCQVGAEYAGERAGDEGAALNWCGQWRRLTGGRNWWCMGRGCARDEAHFLRATAEDPLQRIEVAGPRPADIA